jgi:arsenate reductase
VKATIYHNGKCGTSRKTLDILENTPGLEVEVIRYLETPPGRERLKGLYERAGITPREGLRAKEPLAQELGLAQAGDEAILDAMMAHPILIERPRSRPTRACASAGPRSACARSSSSRIADCRPFAARLRARHDPDHAPDRRRARPFPRGI